MTSASRSRPCNSTRSDLRFIIIGAGMAGVLSAIKLRQAGFDNFTIYEKADRLGGTWRENTYPGIACDVPSHLYRYSFAPNPGWSHRFSPGAEIQAYFEDVAHRYDVVAQIQFGKEITRCEYANGRWTIAAADGSVDAADFIIAATGVLHHPSTPDIEGLAAFAGTAFHSARWPHDLTVVGKRVGVVGTGSTAIQLVSALVDDVAELSLFQRTAQWVMPIENPPYSEAAKAEFRTRPETMRQLRSEMSHLLIKGFSNALVDANSPELQGIHDACVANLESNVTDPALRERLRPSYRAACKRLVMSGDFYAAIQRPNARLVTETIDRMEPSGLRTCDGQVHALDVLVFATGFRVDSFMRPMRIVGRHGTVLDDVWTHGPFAYLAISVPEFPNFFMLNGPNGPVGNFSLIDVAELQFGYIMQLVERVRSGACRALSVSRSAAERFDAARKRAAQATIWKSGCQSWYLDADGVPTAWPWTFDRFEAEMAAPRFDDFEQQ